MKLKSLVGCVLVAAAPTVGSDNTDVKQVAIIGQYITVIHLKHPETLWICIHVTAGVVSSLVVSAYQVAVRPSPRLTCKPLCATGY